MNKKLGIFDLDGTLVDAYNAISATFNYSLGILGYPIVSVETVKRAVGGGSRNLASKFVKEEHVSELMAIYKNNHKRFLKGNVKLFQGGEELLKFLLDRDLLLGVATNRSKVSAGELLNELNMRRYFDIICTEDDVSKAKPSPDMILHIMDFHKVKPEETFYVGDMDVDFLAGTRAGVDTFLLSTGSTPYEDLKKIKDIKIFANLIDFKKYIKDNLKQ